MEARNPQKSWIVTAIKGYRFWLGLLLLLSGGILVCVTRAWVLFSIFGVGILFVAYAFFTSYLKTLKEEPPTPWPRSTFEAYRFLVYVLIFTSGAVLVLIRERTDSSVIAAIALGLTIIGGIFLLDFLGGGIKKDKESDSANCKEHIVEMDYYNHKIVVYLLNFQMAVFLIGLTAIALNMVID